MENSFSEVDKKNEIMRTNINKDFDTENVTRGGSDHPGPNSDGYFPVSKGYPIKLKSGSSTPWNIIIGTENDGPHSEKIQKEWINRGMAEWDANSKTLLWRMRYMWEDDNGNQSEDGKGDLVRNVKDKTLWRKLPKKLYFDDTNESSVTIKMFWKNDTRGIPDDRKPDERCTCDIGEEGNGLRCLAGTGDIRLSLFEGIFKENGDVDTHIDSKRNMKYWPGYQIRFNPHVDKKYGEYTGKNDVSNASHWYRNRPAGDDYLGLADDWIQNDDHHGGFDKIGTTTGLKFPLSSHAPFDEWFPVELTLTRRKSGSDYFYQSTLKIHNEVKEIREYKFEADDSRMKKLDYVDVISLTNTNARPYGVLNIKLLDNEEDNKDTDDENTNGKGLIVEAEHAVLRGFETRSDSSASNGRYIFSNGHYMRGKNDNYKAEFKYNVTKPGRYKVRARISSKGADSGSDSFYLKVDGGSVKTFHTIHTSSWVTKDYKDTFELQSGIRSVIIYAREKKTCLDKLELVFVEDLPQEKLKIEAENASLKGFNVRSDSGASNNKYIYSDKHTMSKYNSDYRAEFKFYVKDSGKYKIRATVSSKGEDKGADSFYLRVNGGSVKAFHTVNTSSWKTKDFKDSFNLNKGEVKVIIYAREKKTCLDKLELIKD